MVPEPHPRTSAPRAAALGLLTSSRRRGRRLGHAGHDATIPVRRARRRGGGGGAAATRPCHAERAAGFAGLGHCGVSAGVDGVMRRRRRVC